LNPQSAIRNPQSAILAVAGLSKSYPTPSGPLDVLTDVAFQLSAREALAILGPSGSGKSTLLFILGALEPPTAGKVTLDGTDPHALSERDQAEFRNRKVGFIFQDHHLLPQLTLLENVLVPTLLRRDIAPAEHVARARKLIARVGLESRIDHLPAELSGGERQRAAIARALAGRPAMVLADEPTGNLDRENARQVGDLLLELQREEGSILILATHSLDLAARLPRRAEIVGGRFRPADGAPVAGGEGR
jgi:lipoprotein-releasing system ATP-binding protein